MWDEGCRWPYPYCSGLAALASGLTVDTGSSLSTSDWMDIDSKDLVARAKATVGFKIMREIQPWTSAAQGGQV